LSDEHERVAAELRRIRDEVRERARGEPAALDAPRPAAVRELPPRPAEPPRPQAPPPPDGSAVNALWEARPARALSGLRGLLGRRIAALLAPEREAQVAFNSRQVQLDNELVAYVDARFADTHRHYDHVLGLVGRHLNEADERHMILQEELVAHVHDLVKRIDLVLGEGERGRLSLEFALKDLRARLVALEERIGRG
jgi:hypothetical protein